MKHTIAVALATTFLLFAGLPAPVHAEVDAAAAEKLMKANKCGSCHHATKTKSGPSLKDMAAELKGKADAEQRVIDVITKETMIEIDGEKEAHKLIKTTDPVALKNLAQWILAH